MPQSPDHAFPLTLLQRVRRRLRPAQPDFADHGTAFGLELTLSLPAALESESTAPRRGLPWRRSRGPGAQP